MAPDKNALLLIEYQHDCVSKGGAQHDAVTKNVPMLSRRMTHDAFLAEQEARA